MSSIESDAARSRARLDEMAKKASGILPNHPIAAPGTSPEMATSFMLDTIVVVNGKPGERSFLFNPNLGLFSSELTPEGCIPLRDERLSMKTVGGVTVEFPAPRWEPKGINPATDEEVILYENHVNSRLKALATRKHIDAQNAALAAYKQSRELGL